MNKKGKHLKWTVALLLVSLLTGCKSNASTDTAASGSYNSPAENYGYTESGLASSYGTYDSTAEVAEEEKEATDNLDNGQSSSLDSMSLMEEKLVYHCDLEIETTEYTESLLSIKNTIEKYDGIIQSENETDSSYDWYYEDYQKTRGTMSNYLQIRIPSANYDSFIQEMDGIGKIISKNTSVENISQMYYDTSVEIEALETQEKNLLVMLEDCETIEDMILVQDRLTEVQYQLNQLKTDLHYMDIDVAYSYININITEVMEYHYDEPMKANTFLNRLADTLKDTWWGFLDFMEGLLFLIIRLIPYLILGTIVLFLLRKPIRKWRQKRKEKKALKNKGL